MQRPTIYLFCRPPHNKDDAIEDGNFIDYEKGIFGAADANSTAYSPSNPAKIFDGKTDGQLVIGTLVRSIYNSSKYSNAENCVLDANNVLYNWHNQNRLRPGRDDVPGASFAICKLHDSHVELCSGGDCFTFFKDKERWNCICPIDSEAFNTEEKAKQDFAECLEEANGDMKMAWDIYYPILTQRRIDFSNAKIGSGGYAQLNGDPALKGCMKLSIISGDVDTILFLTDGLLPSSKTHPDHYSELAKEVGNIYEAGGISAIVKWRDENESLLHTKGHPEGTALVLQFAI